MNQNYEDWECLVIDDFSTDNTREVIYSYNLLDNRIKYFTNNRKKGAQGSRNTGIVEASGGIICFLDSDDILTWGSINNRLPYFDNCNIEIVYGNFLKRKFLNINGNSNQAQVVFKNLSLAPFSVIMCRKDLFKNGLLDENFQSWQDDDFFLVNVKKNNIVYVDGVVADFNSIGNSFSITSNKNILKFGFKNIVLKHYKLIIQYCGFIHLVYCLLRYQLYSFRISKIGRLLLNFYVFEILFKKFYGLILKKFDVIYVR